MCFALGALQAATQLVEVVQLKEEGAVGEARETSLGDQPKPTVRRWPNSASSRRYSPDLRQRSKFVMTMSLPLREASAAKKPKLMRSRSASLRERSLDSSFLSRVRDYRRSLAGGLPSVCMTRSCPAYDGR
eukprot:3556878-Pleurochrysis_carterae.AAC.1